MTCSSEGDTVDAAYDSDGSTTMTITFNGSIDAMTRIVATSAPGVTPITYQQGGSQNFKVGDVVFIGDTTTPLPDGVTSVQWPAATVMTRNLDPTGYFLTGIVVTFPQLPTRGNVYPTSDVIDGLSDTSGMSYGQAVIGSGINSQAVVTGIIDATRIVIGAPDDAGPLVTLNPPIATSEALTFVQPTRPTTGTCVVAFWYYPEVGRGFNGSVFPWEDVTDQWVSLSIEIIVDSSSVMDDGSTTTTTIASGSATRNLAPSQNDPALPGQLATLWSGRNTSDSNPNPQNVPGIIEANAFRVYKPKGCCFNCFVVFLLNFATGTEPSGSNPDQTDPTLGSITVTYSQVKVTPPSPPDSTETIHNLSPTFGYADRGVFCYESTQDNSNPASLIGLLSASVFYPEGYYYPGGYFPAASLNVPINGCNPSGSWTIHAVPRAGSTQNGVTSSYTCSDRITISISTKA